MSDQFELHERLAADTFVVGDMQLSRLLLLNDCRYPWLILVPRVPKLREIHHLQREDQVQLLDESCRVAAFMEKQFEPDKLNVGALGNLVPQLHLHHIARYESDPAWPGPVWGHSAAVPYEKDAGETMVEFVRNGLAV